MFSISNLGWQSYEPISQSISGLLTNSVQRSVQTTPEHGRAPNRKIFNLKRAPRVLHVFRVPALPQTEHPACFHRCPEAPSAAPAAAAVPAPHPGLCPVPGAQRAPCAPHCTRCGLRFSCSGMTSRTQPRHNPDCFPWKESLVECFPKQK